MIQSPIAKAVKCIRPQSIPDKRKTGTEKVRVKEFKADLNRVYSQEELAVMLRQMKRASATFYFAATRIGNHAFIEFTGLMNEYIKRASRHISVERISPPSTSTMAEA